MPYKRPSNSKSEAIEARRKWNEENLDRLSISVPKGNKAVIQAAAAAAGLSVNAWVSQAIEDKLQKESAEG